jgi:Zn-dependent protease
MLRRVVWTVVAFPLGLVLVTLAVVNGHRVRLVLDPFRPEDPVLSLLLPFYVYLFGAVLTGVVLGGMAMWMTQARWRRMARRRGADAVRWQAEADRLTRERDKQHTSVRQLAPVDR